MTQPHDPRVPESGVERPAAGTVLVIEDEPQVRRVTSMMLRRMGFDVLEAATADEATGHIESRGLEIDLIVSDVVMPGVRGPSLVERLRARAPRAGILFVSGYPEPSAPDAAILARHHFLPKPFTPDDLARAVRRALAG